MCGIIGRIFKDPVQSPSLTIRDLSSLAHRGPDGNGVYNDSYAQLGHTRLAIVDLTDMGHQPMLCPDRRFVVTYNGEIYNYIELKKELESIGERFYTNSDTEVLLIAYKIWGLECVKHFRGMFAFALWDTKEKTLLLARDRCGEKPLFYYRDENCLIFASELKGLIPLLERRPSLNPAVVDMYLHYQYVPEPFTLLNGIHKLPAAHTLWVSLGNWRNEPQRYWNVEEGVDSSSLPIDTKGILTSIRDGLEEAVNLTLRSDVPVGVALSGGIDSGAIAAFAQKHYPEPMHAFCVGYPGRPPYDERDQAKKLAESLGMIVHEVELPVQGFVDFFPSLVRIMDEPIADPAAFAHYSVPQAAADLDIKVLLTGIGGDEIFWGYQWVAKSVVTNQMLHKKHLLGPLATWVGVPSVQRFLRSVAHHPRTPPPMKDWAEILLLDNTSSPSEQLSFFMETPDFRHAFRLKSEVYGTAMRTLDVANPFRPTNIGSRKLAEIPAAIIRMLFDTWLVSNCLTLGDRVGMSVGVECRLPFLDVRLIELVMALRAKTPDHKLGQKFWLRGALKGVLPDDVLLRPKAGFQPPVWDWLSKVVERYGDILRGGQLVKEDIIDPEKVDYLLLKMPSQKMASLFFVYKLVLLEMWFRKVVEA